MIQFSSTHPSEAASAVRVAIMTNLIRWLFSRSKIEEPPPLAEVNFFIVRPSFLRTRFMNTKAPGDYKHPAGHVVIDNSNLEINR
jgi:hypothetical protein